MADLNAICPACGQVLRIPGADLIAPCTCPGCQRSFRPERNGLSAILHPLAGEPESGAVRDLVERAQSAPPEEAHALLQQALALNPGSFSAHRELLYLGNLHLRFKRRGNFALIKCYLLHPLEEPRQYNEKKRRAIYDELFAGEQLRRTQGLSGDPDGFLRTYLNHLADEYLRLFIKERTSVKSLPLGIPRSREQATLKAREILHAMEENLKADPLLSEGQRGLLLEALRGAATRALGAG